MLYVTQKNVEKHGVDNREIRPEEGRPSAVHRCRRREAGGQTPHLGVKQGLEFATAGMPRHACLMRTCLMRPDRAAVTMPGMVVRMHACHHCLFGQHSLL